MHRTIPTLIVGPTASLREELTNKLALPAFRVVVCKPSLSEVVFEELPSEHCLFVIEAAETPRLLIVQIAQLKQRNPLSRIVLLGADWAVPDISAAFKAGTNAYFADTTVSAEFLKAIKLITR